jgi:hypothetical protein
MSGAALALIAAFAAPPRPAVIPLVNAHAHNDYWHARPLFDALDNGFCSVEADVLLVGGELRVGHDKYEAQPGRTLEKLYLAPLRRRVKANGGKVYRGGPDFYLLIDVKTEAKTTYQAIDKALARYADILSVTRDGRFERKAVTALITGNCARAAIQAQKVRYAAIEGGPADLDSNPPVQLIPSVGADWAAHFRWDGEGPMPAAERNRLRAMVHKAHLQKRRVRFWATPETRAMWRELRAAGVDLINTDELAKLRRYLRKERWTSRE